MVTNEEKEKRRRKAQVEVLICKDLHRQKMPMMAYSNVYAGLIVIAVLFYLLITVLFKVRDRVLGWQKGVIIW